MAPARGRREQAGRPEASRTSWRIGAAVAAACLVLALAAAARPPAATAAPGEPAPGTLQLADTARVAAGAVRLRDLATGPVPAAAGELVLAEGRPGQTLAIGRGEALRALVVAGLAGGVRLAGAASCLVRVGGREPGAPEVRRRAIALLQPELPAAAPGAPAPWLEVELEVPAVGGTDGWDLSLLPGGPLRPGRNLVGMMLAAGGRRTRLSATVTCHLYGETAVAAAAIAREQPLSESLFVWSWSDLAQLPSGLAVGRERVAGCGAARDLAAGADLRESDLRPIPLVRRGEPVELVVSRGGVSVSVTAEARQDGRLGQIVSVRNTLDGAVVAGRVTGPGLVEWRHR